MCSYLYIVKWYYDSERMKKDVDRSYYAINCLKGLVANIRSLRQKQYMEYGVEMKTTTQHLCLLRPVVLWYRCIRCASTQQFANKFDKDK